MAFASELEILHDEHCNTGEGERQACAFLRRKVEIFRFNDAS